MDRDALIRVFDKEADRHEIGGRFVDALIEHEPEITDDGWSLYRNPAIEVLGWAWSAVLSDELMRADLHQFCPSFSSGRFPRDPSLYLYCVWRRMGAHRDDRLIGICRFPHQVGLLMARDLMERDKPLVDREYTAPELIALYDDHWYEYTFSLERLE